MTRTVLLVIVAVFGSHAGAQQNHDAHRGHDNHQMQLDTSGVVMNSNRDKLPRDCDAISRDYEFTIRAGRHYAADIPGRIFGMSQHELRVQPCSRITVTFINDDEVRHQWMVHRLPKYLYPAGMFHLEAMGGQSVTGTFIVPAEDRTYLVHCDMAQHMEKGMKGQVVVGRGNGDLWSIAGTSDSFLRDNYLPRNSAVLLAIAAIGIFIFGLWWVRKFTT